MQNPSKHLLTAIDAAKSGANVALSYFKSDLGLRFELKEDTSSLTIADVKTEEAIKNRILSDFPEAKFIAEESSEKLVHADEVWIIDPIDGTTEFSKGIDLWGIMVAYAVGNDVKVGVCYFPKQDALIISEKGKGAYVNGQKIHVSGTPTLSKSFVGLSSIKYYKDKEKEKMVDILGHVWSLRCLSSSISCYFVASGKFDFFIASSNNAIWDVAPFIRVIEEAGGEVSDWKGNKLSIRNVRSNMVISNRILHKGIIKLLNS